MDLRIYEKNKEKEKDEGIYFLELVQEPNQIVLRVKNKQGYTVTDLLAITDKGRLILFNYISKIFQTDEENKNALKVFYSEE